ncbi:hypothetical protein ceV_018 [Chrysochromulina ericina virus CeV-01B]|uniref:Uncharacterized protein n=1 Tax=Chrysochromulina ericina virus CeV-01B TaxID=3070830 RepID=A0A0N9QWP9_9VIRU|nr:hypothetical protein ceV_018 [Chrysochromulina ericina virus]ALH22924.1 hypothetical protein ceV_018 [Chrysochromulina ericina virus CeV-01B]
MNISDSNKKLINLLESNEPFIISRLGLGAETYICYEYLKLNKFNPVYLNKLSNNAGIYNVDPVNFKIFLNLYISCVKNSKYLACMRTAVEEQLYFINRFNLDILHSRALEPYYICLENEKPWSHYLIGKKVLIINPFVDSFKKQLQNNFQIFKDPNKKIFLDGQEFVFYKTYQTSAGNHIHKNWLETCKLMTNDISKLDFDIALLGCGGYGLPLCEFIKSKMNKSAIYIGGGLQLLFGVMGKRWESNPLWHKIIRENNSKFIRPSNNEILKKNHLVEEGCYW